MKKDLTYLRHILDAIDRILQYTTNVQKEDFLNNPLLQDGVIRQIEIIGEATKRLSYELRSKYNNVPWKDMAGMRDKLIHDYMGVDIEAVWDTVEHDIPILKKTMVLIIQDYEE